MRRAVRWCWRRTVPALWVLSVLSLIGLLGSAPPVAATPVGPAHANNYDESAAVAPAATTAHPPGKAWDALGADATAGRSPVVDGHVYDAPAELVAPNSLF